jgi:membrane-associated phospholipid phosphatase
MAADGALPATLVARSETAGARDQAAVSRNRRALRFLAYAVPFVVTGLAYEALRPLSRFRPEVHVGDLFDLEARVFPVDTAAGTVALSDVIARQKHVLLDLVCGTSYVLFLAELIGVAVLLFFRARPRMLAISLGFLLVNLSGWVIWMLYPAAPPWYVDLYGKGPAVLSAASSPAGLLRLDALVGLPIAGAFYAKSANVFGAMPSLHVAYATLVAFVSFPLRGALRVLTLLFAASIAFSAVYLRHHYILDVLAGVLLALPVAWLSVRLAERLDRSGWGRS